MMDNVQAVASAASSPYLESVKTWIIYAGVLIGSIITAWAGIRKAYRDLKKSESNPAIYPAASKEVVGATLLENYTLLMWSESNRSVVEALGDALEKINSLTNAVNYNTDAVREGRDESKELRHQIERLRDKLP